MSVISKSPRAFILLAMLTGTASASWATQPQQPPDADLTVTVSDEARPAAAEMTAGPTLVGFISARNSGRMQVTAADGTNTVVAVNDATRIRAGGGFLGMGRSGLGADSLLNGVPVTVRTLQSGSGLVASQIDLKNRDLKTAAMIRHGTAQGFAEQSAATEALRSRMGDIGDYNVKSTTNVNFAIGQAVLSEQAKGDLCATATAAQGMKNAIILVVGYTDSTGSAELNQQLSERRAGRVVNYLQQVCGWKPYRMLSPTGMSEADPLAGNETAQGRSQNRRVAVNVLVSKGLDGM